MKFNTLLGAAILLAGSAVAAPDVDAFKKTRAALFAETSDDNATKESIISRDEAVADAGAALSGAPITKVKGTFFAPKTLSEGSGAAWVGLDGGSCAASLRGGITWESDGTYFVYIAWFQWSPHAPEMMDLQVNQNDLIKVTISTTSQYAGTVTIENLTTQQAASNEFGGPDHDQTPALCFARAEWTVGAAKQSVNYPGRANLGTIAFTGASAIQNGVSVGIGGAKVFNDQHSEVVLKFTDTILVRQK